MQVLNPTIRDGEREVLNHIPCCRELSSCESSAACNVREKAAENTASLSNKRNLNRVYDTFTVKTKPGLFVKSFCHLSVGPGGEENVDALGSLATVSPVQGCITKLLHERVCRPYKKRTARAPLKCVGVGDVYDLEIWCDVHKVLLCIQRYFWAL